MPTTMLTGTANPSPSAPTSLTPMAVVMPIRRPLPSRSAPPLEPARDRRVGLDEAVQLLGGCNGEPPVEGRDDAGGHGRCALQAKRIADGDGGVADANVRDVGEFDGGQIGSGDLDHSHIGQRVGTDHLGLVDATIRENHPNELCVLNDMVVGEYVAVGAEHHAGS